MTLIVPLPFLSTEDWRFTVAAVDANGAAYDLSPYAIQCEFRETPNGVVIANLSLGNGITLQTDTSMIAFVSYVGDRNYLPTAARTMVYGDIMITETISGKVNTWALGRITLQITPGVTHA